jgi:hypothetical protein
MCARGFASLHKLALASAIAGSMSCCGAKAGR